MNIECQNIVTLIINGQVIQDPHPLYDNVKTMACEIAQWFSENFDRMDLPNHGYLDNRFLYKVLLNNCLWRSEILNPNDIGLILLHMDRVLLEAHTPPAEGYEWKDQIIPSFQRVFNLSYEMFPLPDGEEFKDWFVHGVEDDQPNIHHLHLRILVKVTLGAWWRSP